MRAALAALRELEPSRLVAVFQPHLYSRTKALAVEFGAALALADEAVVLDVYPAREEPVGELAEVSGLRVAQAAAERAEGRPVWWLPRTAELAERALAERLDRRPAPLRRGDAAGHDRRRRRLQRSARPWSPRRPDERRPRGPEPGLPAGAPDHGADRRRGRLVRPARRRGEPARGAALGRRGGAAGRPGRLGVEPAGRRRGLPRAGAEARRRAGGDRARGRAGRLRRRRPPPLGGGESRRLGPLGPRVRGQHPRHRGRRGADERQRLRRPAGAGAGVGRRLHRDRARPPHPRAARLHLPPLEPARGRGRRPRLVPPRSPPTRGDPRDPGRDAGAPPRGAAVRDQDLRLDLQEPRRRARRGQVRRASCWRRRAAVASVTAAPASPRSTPTSSRTTATPPPPTCSS